MSELKSPMVEIVLGKKIKSPKINAIMDFSKIDFYKYSSPKPAKITEKDGLVIWHFKK